MKPSVQISLDLTSIDEALETTALALRAGVDWLDDLGCDSMIHHVGYDERRGIAAAGLRMPSPIDQLREVMQAVSVPVQAVGGLTLKQAVQCPQHGAPLVVLSLQ